MDLYAIYLRKSRADMEAESRGEGETLARHRETLLSLSKARGLSVGAIYEEIVSGDTISARPEMQKLLRDLEQRRWCGVICMDIDRLGRGDSTDQGRILKTIKYAGAVIVTLYKTFDPRNEMDEEFFEYGQFMSRGEYRRIKRRMWAGREASAREGKWQSPKAPFGYERVKLIGEKGWTLKPVPGADDAVRMCFELYAYGDGPGKIGTPTIAYRLNDMGYRTQSGKPFDGNGVRQILANPAYCGKVRWNMRRSVITMVDGREVVKRPKSSECFISPGRHPAIVSQELWDAVQTRLSHNAPHVRSDLWITNPFCGVMRCSICGSAMVAKTSYNVTPPFISVVCSRPRCPTSGIGITYVEEAVFGILHQWLDFSRPGAKITFSDSSCARADQLSSLRKQLDSLNARQARLYDLLETGVYDTPTFLSRKASLSESFDSIRAQIEHLESMPDPDADLKAIIALAPKIQHVLDSYPRTKTNEEKNILIRTVIREIIYTKSRRCYRNENPGDFMSLDVFPVL